MQAFERSPKFVPNARALKQTNRSNSTRTRTDRFPAVYSSEAANRDHWDTHRAADFGKFGRTLGWTKGPFGRRIEDWAKENIVGPGALCPARLL